jgi:hypothetical protein
MVAAAINWYGQPYLACVIATRGQWRHESVFLTHLHDGYNGGSADGRTSFGDGNKEMVAV